MHVKNEEETDPSKKEIDYYIYNHIRFNIRYHDVPGTSTSRVVGFELEPFTVKHSYEKWPEDDTKEKPNLLTCNKDKQVDHTMKAQGINGDEEEIIWTYDVRWISSEVEWVILIYYYYI